MKNLYTLALVAMLAGCDTLHSAGIGGEPQLYCRQGQAVIDDRIAGPDSARLSVVRRFRDGDALCSTQHGQPPNDQGK